MSSPPRRLEPVLWWQVGWEEQRLDLDEICDRGCLCVVPLTNDRGGDVLEGPPPATIGVLCGPERVFTQGLALWATTTH